MANRITIESARGYATEANLDTALKSRGLDDLGIRYVVCLKPDGKWTAVFLMTEHLQREGGYIGIAAQHGFCSV